MAKAARSSRSAAALTPAATKGSPSATKGTTAAAPAKKTKDTSKSAASAKPEKTIPAAKKAKDVKPKVSSILITQPKPETDRSPYFDLALKYNLKLDFHPFIRVEGVAGRDFRRQKVDIAEHTAIIFTSRNAVDHFFRICEEMKVKVSQEMKYVCITEAVALYLQKFILYRKRKVFFSADGSTKGMMDVITKHKAEKYVLPVSDSGRNEVHAHLTRLNIPFSEVSLFKTVPNDIASVMKTAYDMIVFFSPFSVQTLFQHDPGFSQNGTLIGAFGPSTTKAVEDAGLRLDVKAPAPNAPSMVTALEQYLGAKKSGS